MIDVDQVIKMKHDRKENMNMHYSSVYFYIRSFVLYHFAFPWTAPSTASCMTLLTYDEPIASRDATRMYPLSESLQSPERRPQVDPSPLHPAARAGDRSSFS